MADPRSTAVLPSPKVSVPLPVDRAVQRPRLWPAALDHGPNDLHVLLACAPAGVGKSSMLAEFAEHHIRTAHDG